MRRRATRRTGPRVAAVVCAELEDAMPKSYETYKDEVREEVTNLLSDLQCQPILFVGSGFSQRYFGAPTWDKLLEHLARECPLLSNKAIAYYRQKYPSPAECAQVFAEQYREWAWNEGKEEFDEKLFVAGTPKQAYIKAYAAKYFESITPGSIDDIPSASSREELHRLKQIAPHAVITTNYDTFLEVLFPDYVRVVGQKVLRQAGVSIGEVFKIHGCTTAPESLVLTQDDYNWFAQRQKYLSAKLLTYFAEHPLLFVGYSATDLNIRAILADIAEIVAAESGVIPNIFFLSWSKDPLTSYRTQREEVIPVGEQRSVRVRKIEAHDFGWVFDAFATKGPIENVNVRKMRALVARMYQAIRCDVPRGLIELDYASAEASLRKGREDTTVLGIAPLSDPTAVNLDYPYSLMELAGKLGDTYWYAANELIKEIHAETGIDIKAADNVYHLAVRAGRKGVTHRYSEKALGLLQAKRLGEPYQLDQDELPASKKARAK